MSVARTVGLSTASEKVSAIDFYLKGRASLGRAIGANHAGTQPKQKWRQGKSVMSNAAGVVLANLSGSENCPRFVPEKSK